MVEDCTAMRLYINSGTHSFTNVDSRVAEFENAVSEPGVVFIEDSDSPLIISELATTFVLAPLLVGIMIIWVFGILPVIRPIFGDDREVENKIAQKYDAELVSVDISKLDLIQERWLMWSLANWLLIVTTPIYHIDYFINLLTLFVIQGVAMFLAFLAGVHHIRNMYIAENIAENADNCSEAVFVTGRKHHEPVAELLDDHEQVRVVNPTVDS